jgi:hypothetical protein
VAFAIFIFPLPCSCSRHPTGEPTVSISEPMALTVTPTIPCLEDSTDKELQHLNLDVNLTDVNHSKVKEPSSSIASVSDPM